MNAPERHRSYQLDEGQARVTYEPDEAISCGRRPSTSTTPAFVRWSRMKLTH